MARIPSTKACGSVIPYPLPECALLSALRGLRSTVCGPRSAEGGAPASLQNAFPTSRFGVGNYVDRKIVDRPNFRQGQQTGSATPGRAAQRRPCRHAPRDPEDRITPSTCTASLKARACARAFCPLVASSTSQTWCGASSRAFPIPRWIFLNSSIKLKRVCKRPAVSIRMTSTLQAIPTADSGQQNAKFAIRDLCNEFLQRTQLYHVDFVIYCIP